MAAHEGGPRCVLLCRFLAILTAVLAVGPAIAAPPGAIISNQATLYFEPSPGLTVTVDSNIVELTTAVVRSPASVEFTRVVGAGSGDYQEPVGPSSCYQGGAFVLLADPVLIGGGTIDPAQTADVSATTAYNLGEVAFIRLVDSDQNLDFQSVDYAVVTVSNATSGDSETLQLAETGLDTGVFAGYVATTGGAAVIGDCVLQAASGSTIVVDYVDPADASDVANADAVKAALERVKVRKKSQQVEARNTTHLTPEQQRQIDEADARRKKMKQEKS